MARYILFLVVVPAVLAVQVPEAPPPDPVVEKALAYLDGTQGDKGDWTLARNPNNVAGTGLTVLAYLSAGVTVTDAKRGPALKKAVVYLLTTQDQAGQFREPRGNSMLYSHGIALWAVAEYAAAHKNPPENLKPALARAVALLVKAQHEKGGWRYAPYPNPGDLSITSWQVLGLRAARKAGVEVPEATLQRALKFVDSCRRQDLGFLYVPNGGAPVPACTASGVLHLSLGGADSGRPDMVALRDVMLKQITANSNYLVYGAHAQAQALARFPGKEAEAGLAQLRERLVKLQTDKGAFDNRAGADANYGPGFCTPTAVLALTAKDRRLAVMKPEK